MDNRTRKLVEASLLSYPGRNTVDMDKEIELIEKDGAFIITIEDERYPENLKHIYNPPLALYVKGRLEPEDYFSIAIVGARKASSYGTETAERLGRELAERGFTVTSGMARGIDTSAHKGALSAGGRTIAVLGCGVNITYPPENEDIMNRIGQKGAVISEFPMNFPPLKLNFPKRNRIISGLSLGVVVVEAAQRSGALITASFALDQGREVFSVPGRVDAPTSRGTLGLIKEGAKLVESVDDILEELRNMPKAQKTCGREARAERKIELTEEEKKVFESLSEEPTYIDEIKNNCDLDISSLAGVLLKLELKKAVKALPGKKFMRSSI